MHIIEEENYNALEAIYTAELAKLGKYAVISKKILLAEDSSASSDIPEDDVCLRVMSDKRVVAANAFQHIIFNINLCSLAP